MLSNHTLSIVTGCRDRESFLLQVLPTWLQEKAVDEIIIVDWSSAVPLRETLADFLTLNRNRLKVAVAHNQTRWNASKCRNLGLQVATGDIVLRLDSDVILYPGFPSQHPMRRGVFYARTPHRPSPLWGTCLVWRRDILGVNGYNERLIGYGWEDDDLFNRLQYFGLSQLGVDFSLLKHIDHNDELRLANQPEKADSPLPPTLHSTFRNQKIAAQDPWTSSDHMTYWRAVPDDDILICTPLTNEVLPEQNSVQ